MYKNTFQNVKYFLRKKSGVHIRTSYVDGQNVDEKDIFVARMKKIKKCLVNSYNQALKIVEFTKATKNVHFHQNLVHAHIMSGFTHGNFFELFSLFKMCI